MKKFITLFILLLCCTNIFAQFTLSGKITDYSGKEQLKVNIPLVFGFYKENSIDIPVAADGTFSIVLPITKQKFANLIFKREFHPLLLSANKDLFVQLSEADKNVNISAGTALPENKILTEINLEEYPSFMEKQDVLAGMNLASLYSQVVDPYFARRDEKIAAIDKSPIAAGDKKIIASEVKYMAYNYLNDLNWLRLKNKSSIDSLTTDIFSKEEIKPQTAATGPKYYAYKRNYLGYLQNKAFSTMKRENIKPNEPLPYYGMSLDSMNVIVEKYGQPYLRYLLAAKNLPVAVTEQLTYQEIATLFYDKDLEHLQIMADLFSQKFSQSIYNADIWNKINTLKGLLAKNETNPDIVVVDNYKNVASIYDVIKSFKGKVVYLDVWGTWCGPCKEELKFTPQLKQTFKDKDVAFVYLDLDGDERDIIWKEFIKVNSLIGTHLRKSRETIMPFWKELLADNKDKQEYYPQYFIFDKEGKVAVSKALSPSRGDALYKQINEVLNKN